MIYTIKKVFRYINILGLNRTIEKIITYLHNKNYIINLKFIKKFRQVNKNKFVSIIGCGNFSFSTISFFLAKESKDFLISCFDTDKKKSDSLTKFFGGYVAENIDEILNNDNIRLVYIASNHNSHCEYAVSLISKNKNVHIEKPHVVNFEQLKNLNNAMKLNPKVRVFMGFNRPFSKYTKILKKELDKEKGYNISNFFILGHKLDSTHWYYDPKEGSRLISNLCHWTDLLLHLTPYDEIFPISIIPSSPKDKSNFSVSIIFNKKSFSNLIFTSNANTFEGVRETINIQRGDIYAKIIDYKHLDIVRNQKIVYSNSAIKDQGHEQSVLNSYNSVLSNSSQPPSRKDIILTAYFFLKIDESLKNNKIIEIKEKDFLEFYR